MKNEIADEIKDEYITVESAESRFISASQADDFALKSEIEALKDEIGETYVSKTEAQDFAAKSDLSILATA